MSDDDTGTNGANGTHGNGADAARQRLALAQTALLSALVAGTPVPEGFDRGRIRVQSRALAAKRADVTAKVAPELPQILGDDYRPAFLRYAATHPLEGGYRLDALSFAAQVLSEGAGAVADAATRRRLNDWWRERSGPAPLSPGAATRSRRDGRLARLISAARTALPRTGR